MYMEMATCHDIRNHFLSMGYSEFLVDKAIEECGNQNQNAIFESILTYEQISSTFVNMGHSSSIVENAIRDCGTEDENTLLETILTYESLENPFSANNAGPSLSVSDEDDEGDNVFDGFSDFDKSEMQGENSNSSSSEDQLLEMGFTKDEVCSAVEISGIDAPICILVDFIHALRYENSNHNKDAEPMNPFLTAGIKNSRTMRDLLQSWDDDELNFSPRKRAKGKKKHLRELKGSSIFNDIRLSNTQHSSQNHILEQFVQGPPYFYFENVALAPKGSWDTMSRFLYNIPPEFVDSKHFSVSMRKRGYIHNLPRHGRFRLLPLPPMTIHEAFPQTEKFWPEWDDRTKLNCITTSLATAALCERMCSVLKNSDGSLVGKNVILSQCRKWNLLWLGPQQLAPLEPNEMELALGYAKDHTRGASNRTERIKSLGNSFQVDTVAYHLSVLKHLYPEGMTILSLFSGIGGAEVGLDRLGIPIKCVVSAEKSAENRTILRSWWAKTHQEGSLIEVGDVENLTNDKLEELMETCGCFDLIIGGSPCNNLTGSNRVTRIGLDGQQSALFFEFSRIINFILHYSKSGRSA